ncbi:MAG: formylglycine-generating enzyme family protein [Candidatus Riflebacteria bacterium]|nr:formylglycine-generating enzyme family protein [Candidatus Riflebacteria bacterium]
MNHSTVARFPGRCRHALVVLMVGIALLGMGPAGVDSLASDPGSHQGQHGPLHSPMPASIPAGAPPLPPSGPSTQAVVIGPVASASPVAIVPGSGGTIDDERMVTVNAGEFAMGSNLGEPDLKPEHKVYLDEFEIGIHEVTNRRFEQFVKATGYRTRSEVENQSSCWDGRHWTPLPGFDRLHPQGPGSSIEGKAEHPVVHVTWDDAQAFCIWAGKRLPTEAEWEKAARGTDGRLYPWGSEPAADGKTLNLGDRRGYREFHLAFAMVSVDDGHGWAAPVGSYPAGKSPYGLFDAAGNVAEWCSAWYGKDYYAQSPARNPQGPATGAAHVVRGGSFASFEAATRSVVRAKLEVGGRDCATGFRCARSKK